MRTLSHRKKAVGVNVPSLTASPVSAPEAAGLAAGQAEERQAVLDATD
jgi:hypothetical protein